MIKLRNMRLVALLLALAACKPASAVAPAPVDSPPAPVSAPEAVADPSSMDVVADDPTLVKPRHGFYGEMITENDLWIAPGLQGEPVRLGGLAVTLADLHVITGMGGAGTYYAPPAGARWLSVEYDVKNVTNLPIATETLPTLVLKAPDAATFEEDQEKGRMILLGGNPKYTLGAAGVLNPGVTRHGVAVFEVPDARSDPKVFQVWMVREPADTEQTSAEDTGR